MLGEDLARQFLTDCMERRLSSKTVGDYASQLDIALEWCWKRHLDITQLSRTEIKQCVQRPTKTGGRPAPNTVKTRLIVFKAFYRWLWEEEHIPDNTAAKVRSVKVPVAPPRPIEDDEWQAMWALAFGERVRAAFVLTYYLGLRGNEVRQLRTEQIKHNTIVDLKRKGDETMVLPWRKMLITYAHELPQVMPPDGQAVFTALTAVKKYDTIWPDGQDREWLRDHYKEHSVRAGLSPIIPHRGRASAVSNLLRAGMPLQYVKWLVNISRWQTLEHYVKAGSTEFNEWFYHKYGKVQ